MIGILMSFVLILKEFLSSYKASCNLGDDANNYVLNRLKFSDIRLFENKRKIILHIDKYLWYYIIPSIVTMLGMAFSVIFFIVNRNGL